MFPFPPSLPHMPENLDAVPVLHLLPQMQPGGLRGSHPARWSRETRQHLLRCLPHFCAGRTLAASSVGGGSPPTLTGRGAYAHTLPSVSAPCPAPPLHACVWRADAWRAPSHSLSALSNAALFNGQTWAGVLGSLWGAGRPLSDRSVLLRVLCQAGTVSSCVSWPSRIPTGSGRVCLRVPKWAALGLPGAGWERGRVTTAAWTPQECRAWGRY